MVEAPPVTVPHRSKKKDRHGHTTSHLMDDYFKEEEKKSKELDRAPSGRASPVAPPPKAGGPPRAETSKTGDSQTTE
jgi:hypothetical protein